MIVVKNISSSISGNTLFKGVSFSIGTNHRIGIVGQNGSGKTTLLKLLAGQLSSDTGSISVERERIGYLAQDLVFKDDETIHSYIQTIPVSARDGILKKVGLEKLSRDTCVTTLSGGQKRRLALAALLGDGPTFLLLDEPTNHLDIDGVTWLEEFIEDFRGGVIIVSHDRSLLDNTVKKILEIRSETESVAEYDGNYTAYLAERKKRDGLQNEAYRLQQREKRRLEEWIAKKRQEAKIYDDPSKGKMIRAKERYLEREIIAKAIPRANANRKIHGADIEGSVAHTKLVCRVSSVSKSYSENIVLRNISFELRGNERVLLSGPNGSGKSTLLKMIVGEVLPSEGTIRIGENISVGYFSQEHESLNLENTVLEEFLSTPQLRNNKDARVILGSFLFSGHDVFKKVSVLSLGERVRLIFAKLTNQHHEFLVLDEPTNHLDITSREVIEDALIQFEGAIFAISHDRYFVQAIDFSRELQLRKGVIEKDVLLKSSL